MTDKPKGGAKPRTIACIEAEIAGHQARKSEAALQIGRLEVRRPALLIDLSSDADDKLDSLDKQLARARRLAPRVDAAVTLLQAELATLREAEKEAEDNRSHTAGLAARDEYERLAGKYNVAARSIVEMLNAMERQAEIMRRSSVYIPAPEGAHYLSERLRLPGLLGEPDPHMPGRW